MRIHLVAGLVAGLALLAGCGGQKAADGFDPNVKISPVFEDISMGDANAPVKIVEYASLTCSHCRDFWKQDFPNLKREYIDTGKVLYTFRDLPTSPPAIAVAGVGIARCAGRDKYYAVIDDFYTSQFELLTAAGSAGGARPVLLQIAERAGLTPEQAQACMTNPANGDYINKQIAAKPKEAVNTPSVFINDEFVEDHAFPALKAVIDAKLGVAPAATPSASPTATPTP